MWPLREERLTCWDLDARRRFIGWMTRLMTRKMDKSASWNAIIRDSEWVNWTRVKLIRIIVITVLHKHILIRMGADLKHELIKLKYTNLKTYVGIQFWYLANIWTKAIASSASKLTVLLKRAARVWGPRACRKYPSGVRGPSRDATAVLGLSVLVEMIKGRSRWRTVE